MIPMTYGCPSGSERFCVSQRGGELHIATSNLNLVLFVLICYLELERPVFAGVSVREINGTLSGLRF